MLKRVELPLAALGLIFAYAVFWRGAVLPEIWSQCLLALAALAALYPLLTPRSELAPPLSGRLAWPLALLPCYVAFQLVPLPLGWLKILSPAKARLVESLGQAMPAVSAAPLAVRPSITLLHLLRISGYLIVFLLAREIAWRRPWLSVAPLIAVAAGEALVGLLQYSHLDPARPFVAGTYIDRNHFAGMLEMAFPFALMALTLALRGPAETWLARAGPPLIAAGLILFGIVGSLSRMGFVGAALALLLTGGWELRARFPGRQGRLAGIGFAALLLLGLAILAPSRLAERFHEFATPETAAVDRRLIWEQTLRVIADYPLAGCGLGGYQFTYLKYKTEMPLWSTDFAHNDYLQGIAELGFAGALIAAALLLAILLSTGRGLSRSRAPEARGLAVACAVSLAAILLHSLVDFNLYIPANAMEMAWIAGVSASLPLRRD